MKGRAVFVCLCMLFSLLIFIPIPVINADGSVTDIVINEFLARPNIDWDGDEIYNSADDEWIELYNPTNVVVNVSGCYVGDSGTAKRGITGNAEIPPKGFLVIYGSDNDSLSLNNGGDEVRFYDTDGVTIIDSYDYSDAYADVSEGRKTDGYGSWQLFNIPTPGKRNHDLPPTIVFVYHTPLNPHSSDAVTIVVNASDDYGILFLNLSYSVEGGDFSNIEMRDDGVYPDLDANDGNYTIQIPASSSGTTVCYYITGIDDSSQSVFNPNDAPLSNYTFAFNDEDIGVVINEFLADPASDWDNDGDANYTDEWIELYNPRSTIMSIGGWTIDDTLGYGSPPYMIPSGTVILPNEMLVFYRNTTAIALNNNGDNVTLLNETGVIVDSYTYSDSSDDVAIGRFPDGTENWEDVLLPTPSSQNHYTIDTIENLSNIKINEFLPTPKTYYSTEWIELYNSGSTPVRLDGCLLDDAVNSGKKPYHIPLNTTILPGELWIHYENHGLNNDGDTVNLVYVDGTTIIDSYSYDSSEYDISFGRGTDGGEMWASFSYPSPGQPNGPMDEPNSLETSIMISELFYKVSDFYEFLGLYNPSDIGINISGWRISDGQHSYAGTLIFPEGAVIPPSDRIYIAYNGAIFNDIMDFYPDYEYGNSSGSIPQMIFSETPGFANGKDEVVLLDEFGHLIDIVVYGDSEYQDLGWNGTPIPDAKKGEILTRNFNDINQTYYDTNTSLDWKHIRHYKVGQSDFEYRTYTYTGNITLFSSPDASYETIVNEIEGAKSTIYINLYQFTNWYIAEKVIERLNDGVDVKVLMEGGPTGGIAEEQKFIIQKIVENGGMVKFLATNSTLGARYRYTHAKYAVIDNGSLILSSENWKYTGIPVNNTFGNRGWGVVIRDEATVEYFMDVFREDWSYSDYDIVPFTPDDPKYGNATPDFIVDDWIEPGYYTPIFSSTTLEGEFKFSPVLSPDSSLLENKAILGLINSAVESIYIEQLDIDVNWNEGEMEYDNLYLNAAKKAAKERHVDVRILLSSAYAFPDDPDLDNYDTFVYINDYASRHNITDHLEARLVNYDLLGLSKVHNKGMIVDRNKTLISSINWNRNSVAQNREVGVIIESEDVAEYFVKIFLWDWNEPPIANTGDDITVNVNEPVQFNDLSLDSDGNLSYFWDFDDGTISTEQNPLHTFREEGFYEVRLTVTDGQYSDSDKITVRVLEPEKKGDETAIILSMILLLIFMVIIVVIIVFIKRMR